MSNTTILRPTRGDPPVATATTVRPAAGRHDLQTRGLRSEKITDAHLQRLAIVYVRQSPQQQVLEHRESTARQYALADRAVALGWPRAAVRLIFVQFARRGSVNGLLRSVSARVGHVPKMRR